MLPACRDPDGRRTCWSGFFVLREEREWFASWLMVFMLRNYDAVRLRIRELLLRGESERDPSDGPVACDIVDMDK